MQILTLNINQGPKAADLEDRLYPAVKMEISVGEPPLEQIFDTDITPLEAREAARVEASGAVSSAAMQAVRQLGLDPRIVSWLITQIVTVLRVILPHAREDRVLRAVEDLWEPDGKLMGQIRIETPVWRHFFGNWRQSVDEKRFCDGLITSYFDRADAQVFLLTPTPDGCPVVQRGLAYDVRSADAHAEGTLGSARSIQGVLHGDLEQYAPRLRDAADAVSRMARLTKKAVRLYDVIRDSDGVCQATYSLEAPYYKPAPAWCFPTDVWLDFIFNPEAMEVA